MVVDARSLAIDWPTCVLALIVLVFDVLLHRDRVFAVFVVFEYRLNLHNLLNVNLCNWFVRDANWLAIQLIIRFNRRHAAAPYIDLARVESTRPLDAETQRRRVTRTTRRVRSVNSTRQQTTTDDSRRGSAI